MKARYALTVLVMLLVSLTAVPAGAVPRERAQTPAERAREIAAALAKDPIYIDAAYGSALPENLRADVRTKAKALGYPVYAMVLPLTPSDVFEGKEHNVLTLVMDAMPAKPGLYVVINGGSRFPWYEVRDVPQLDDDRLRPVRQRALDDTGYDAGPTEVLARFFELLAAPGLPPAKRGKTNRPSGSGYSGDGIGTGAKVALGIGAGALVLIAAGLVIGLRRRGGRPRRERTFSIPPHVAATVAAERRRRLTTETTSELTELGSRLAALPAASGEGLRHQQAALDAHHAAGRVLDSSQDLVDVVGAMVLLDRSRREYDLAVAAAKGRKVDDVPPLCAFNPLHGRSAGGPTRVEDKGTTLTLPLCTKCKQALKRRAAPGSLPGEDGPYWHGTDLWARTFFGNVGEDLSTAVSRGEHRS